jgi:hypothetical protein
MYCYALTSSTSTFWYHITNIHYEIWEANGWDKQYPLYALISNEPPDAPPCEEFSQAKFLKRLVDFIIADDQVCCTTYAISFSHIFIIQVPSTC